MSYLHSNPLRLRDAIICALLASAPVQAQTARSDTDAGEDPRKLEEILVIGRPIQTTARISDPATGGDAAADVAMLLRRVPGGNLNSNGALSGQAQYRGLSSLRLSVAIDGQQMVVGGPNFMDPPLHYVPKPLLEGIEVVRGVAPVSSGNGLGGAVRATTKSSDFGDGDRFEPQVDVLSSFRTADEGVAVGGLVGAGNARHRVHILGSFEDGNDFEFDDGVALGTRFQRSVIGGGYGFRDPDFGEISLDYRFHDTDPTGTPALPLDIQKFNTHMGKARYEGEIAGQPVRAEVNVTDVVHIMNNFTIRTAPDNPGRFRRLPAEASKVGFDLDTDFDAWGGLLNVGVEGSYESHSLEITNPNNANFFIRNFNDARIDRTSVFAEWQGKLTTDTEAIAGVRYSHVATEAGDAFAAEMLPPPVRLLADRFNAQDRDKSDDLVDATVNIDHAVNEELSLQIGMGRKTRAPYYVERYAWLPLEVTAGLADGNNHIGDVDLDPEASWVVDLGADWRSDAFYISPSIFWRRVDDYIQGTPFDDTPGVINSPTEMVSAVNGDPTPLQYTNVDARLYGVDAAFGVRLAPKLQFDATVSYVRGERRDIDDDLYRIAPANGVLTLTWKEDSWQVSAEGRLVAEQSKVSVTNDETPTDGYGTLGLFGEWRVMEGIRLVGGVENLLNAEALDHLAGFNRVRDSDVAVGERLPSRGRNGFVRLQLKY